MYPVLIDWHGISVPTWHFCYFLAAIFSLLVLLRLSKQTGDVVHKDLVNIYLICYVSGYFGARIASLIIEEPYTGLVNFFSNIFTLGSLTLYGGIILAVFCASGYVWMKKLPFWTLLDHFILVLLLGICIGRLGCFFNGDDYGLVVSKDNPWGVVFPNLEDGSPRYPTQLFESFFCLVFFLLGYFLFARLRKLFFVGAVGLLGAGSYAIFRFCNEYLRGDFRGWVIENEISTSQFISVIVLLWVLGVFAIKTYRGLKTAKDVPGSELSAK